MAPGKDNSRMAPKTLTAAGRITPDDTKYIRGRVVFQKPGEETGAHVTDGKEEIIIVLEGVATVRLERGKTLVRAGHSFFVAEGMLHNVRNETREPLRYVYVRSLAPGERNDGKHGHSGPAGHQSHARAHHTHEF